MAESLDVNFIRLDQLEAIQKLSLLVRNKNQIKIWFQEKIITNCLPVDVTDTDELLVLFISGQELETYEWNNGAILIHFSVGSMNYFCECKVDGIESDGDLKININSVYRSERRNKERLLTFPHRRVYIYLNVEMEGNGEGNNGQKLVFLNRTPPKEATILKKYIQENAMYDEQLGQLTGFRVLDISKNGVSFITNTVEKNFFLGLNKISEMIVEFNNEIFRLRDAEILYHADYIDPRSISVPMFKVGLYFENGNDELTSRIDKLLGDEQKTVEGKKEFEEFLRCI